MTDVTSIIGLVIGAGVVCFLGQRWRRHRQAAKLADDLLANIVKGKDAFRR